jgi:hypothetical protein
MRGNPHPNTVGLKRTAGPGRPPGSKNKLSVARVEEELRRIATFDPITLFERVRDPTTGKIRRCFTLREIHAMDPETRACIASVKVRTENLTSGDDAQDQTVEVKLWNKLETHRLLTLLTRRLAPVKDLGRGRVQLIESPDDAVSTGAAFQIVPDRPATVTIPNDAGATGQSLVASLWHAAIRTGRLRLLLVHFSRVGTSIGRFLRHRSPRSPCDTFERYRRAQSAEFPNSRVVLARHHASFASSVGLAHLA